MAEFARERDWEQYHSPRNLMLALVRACLEHGGKILLHTLLTAGGSWLGPPLQPVFSLAVSAQLLSSGVWLACLLGPLSVAAALIARTVHICV